MKFRKKAKNPLIYNVSYILRDKDGNIKPLYQPSKLLQFLVKKGLVSPYFKPFFLGKYQNRITIANLITNAGLAGVASRINGAGSESAFTYIAIGTGSTAASVSDTTLATEITTGGGQRANASASRVTTAVTNDTARLTNTFNFSSTFAVVESGVLNASSSGVLLCRQVFSAINVANGDSLSVTWDIQSEDGNA